MSELYERLRKEHYLFVQGKRPQVIEAICERISGRIGKSKFLTQGEIAKKYDITEQSIRNYEDSIMLRLGFDPEEYPTKKSCSRCPHFLISQKTRKHDKELLGRKGGGKQ